MIRIGRLALTAPQSVAFNPRDADSPGVAGPFRELGYNIRGRESGSGAQALMSLLEREAKRWGAVHVVDDNDAVPAGYYIMEPAPSYEKPSGSPTYRPWSISLVRKDAPVIARQAEDDVVAGAAASDRTSEEGFKVIYTATAGETDVLAPRTLGGEPFNLPAGDWKFIVRAQSRITVTQKFRIKITALDGTVIASGLQVTVGAGNADAWVDIDLGIITIPDANDQANWFKLTVQANGDLNDVWLDRLKVVPA